MLSETEAGLPLGLTVCYDLRFPELYRILAVQGALVVTIPAAFTKVTGAVHWEILIRARAIENQAFVVAANQIGPPFRGQGDVRRLADRRPLGRGARPRRGCGRRAGGGGLRGRRPRPRRQEDVREKLPSLANRMAEAYRWPQLEEARG